MEPESRLPAAKGAEDWARLLERLRAMGPLAVALSGGLDSRFLVHAALAAGCEVLALHARGAHIPARESAFAGAWAARRGAPLQTLDVDVLALPGVADNSRQRCYHCKAHLLARLWACAGKRTLCDGTNADDLGQYRPGLRALAEAGARSPLAEAGLGKAHIRALAAATGLEYPAQTARPCLLTRLAYGMRPETALLRRVEAAEAALEALGLREFRLRLTPEPVLQTVPLQGLIAASGGALADAALRQAVLQTLAEHGFDSARLLEEAHVGGFFDR